MAKIVVFEDNPQILKIIGDELRNHDIVAIGQTLSRAFAILGQLACGEVEADFVLLDGNLRSERHDPVFNFGPAYPNTTPRKSRLLAQHTAVNLLVNNAVHGSSYEQPGRDAKAIVDVMQRCNIMAQTIGIGGNTMDYNGVEVDYDLTKNNLIQLVDIIESSVQPD